MINLEVEQEITKTRLDVFVVSQIPEVSRGYVQRLITEKKVLVNNNATKSNYVLKAGDKVAVDYKSSDLTDIPTIDLPIIYEDDNVVVIDKPIGVLSHSKGAFNPEATVDTFVKPKLIDINDSRGGIVHRLDRATSGVIICAKNDTTRTMLQKQFAERRTKKTYYAIVEGSLNPTEAILDLPIERSPNNPSKFKVGPGGKDSQTLYKVIKSNDKYSLLQLKPTTGRTHQLRVHLDYTKHPIVGDTLYGGQKATRMMLHAAELEITIPKGNRKIFKSPLPEEFNEYVR